MVAEDHTGHFEENSSLPLVVEGLHSFYRIFNPLFEERGSLPLDETVGKLALTAFVLDGGVLEVQGTQCSEIIILVVARICGCCQRFCDDHLIEAFVGPVFVLIVASLYQLLSRFVFQLLFLLRFYVP